MKNRRHMKLRALMYEKGVTQAELSEVLGINATSLSHKLGGRSGFTIKEAQEICGYLDIENPAPYFFEP